MHRCLLSLMQTAVMHLARHVRVLEEVCILRCGEFVLLTLSYAAHVLTPEAAMALQITAIDSTQRALRVLPVPTAYRDIGASVQHR